MILHLLIIVFLTFLLRNALAEPGGFYATIELILYTAGLLWAVWRLVYSVMFFFRVRDKGWDLTFGQYFRGYRTLFWYQTGPIPPFEQWQSTRLYEPDSSVVANLITAMKTGLGLEPGTELVPVPFSGQRELLPLVRNYLASEGIESILQENDTGGAFPVTWSSKLLVPKRDLDRASNLVREYLNKPGED